MFSGFFRVVRCMKVVAMRDVRVMARLFMISSLMVLCRFPMMVRSLVMMLGCLMMVIRAFV